MKERCGHPRAQRTPEQIEDQHTPGCICLECELAVAERKAWDSLRRYKFQMFGYWAAIWVHLNRIGRFKKPNPWRSLVRSAREVRT